MSPNIQNLKELIKAAPIGAHIRTNGNAHSMILISKSDTSFTVAQANGGNNNEYSGYSACRIGTATYTWESYVDSSYGPRGINFVKACTLPMFLNMAVNNGLLYNFDCERVGSFDENYVDYERAVTLLFSTPSYLDISDYGMKFEYDKKGYSKMLPLSDAKWIYQNILNWPDEAWEGLLAHAQKNKGYIGKNKYAQITDDGYLRCNEFARGDMCAGVRIADQRADGKRLEVVFNFLPCSFSEGPTISQKEAYYALVEHKSINGKYYWTVYRTKKLRPGENPLSTSPAQPSSTLPAVEAIPAAGTAVARTQKVMLDGGDAEFRCYAVKDAKGNESNYVKIRDLAMALNGTKAQFDVGWDGRITITSHIAYRVTGTEGSTPYSGDQPYTAVSDTPVSFNGASVKLTSFQLKDSAGNGYTYYKLRDLGQLLNFNVKWDGGVVIETDKPYTGK